MTPTLVRLRALMHKELQAIVGDKQSLRLLIMPVIIQLLLFPFAATLEVTNNTLAIVDDDGGAASAELIQRLTQTPAFTRVVRLTSEAEARSYIDRRRALIVLRVPARFSESVARGEPEPIQIILDGRRSNSAQIAMAYIQDILAGLPLAHIERRPDGDAIAIRHWYNENLEYYRFILPSLVAIITTVSALIVTAMSIAREREQGTLDQLLVSPLTPFLIFVGKAAPAIIVALIQASIILVGSVLGYGVPFQGSLLLLYACIVAYAGALIGVGLMISSVCSTQQQAFLGVFLFTMPAIVLSGYVTPVDNMPYWLQIATWANPVRHFILIAKAVYLKAAVFQDFAANVVALLIIGVVNSGFALWVFHRRLS